MSLLSQKTYSAEVFGRKLYHTLRETDVVAQEGLVGSPFVVAVAISGITGMRSGKGPAGEITMAPLQRSFEGAAAEMDAKTARSRASTSTLIAP